MSEAVTKLWCDLCDSHFDEPGGPVYECSRCGQSYVEERRCETDNIFMAKVADSSCPECEAPFESEPEQVEVYEASDGTYHQTPEEAEQWDEDAPAREQRSIENKKWTEALMERMRIESVEGGIKLLPVLRELKEKLPEGFVKIEERLDYELAELERELAYEGPHSKFVSSKWLRVDVPELLYLLMPGDDTRAKIEFSMDYMAEDWQKRREVSMELIGRARKIMEEEFGEDHDWVHGSLDVGSSFISEADKAAPMFLRLIERYREMEETVRL